MRVGCGEERRRLGGPVGHRYRRPRIVLGGGTHCRELTQRHFTGFVDEEVIEKLVELRHSKEPGGPTDLSRAVTSMPSRYEALMSISEYEDEPVLSAAERLRGRVNKASAKPDREFMQSLARGLAVLESFAELGAELTVAELARHTGLSRTVVGRCLHTLELLGYVDQRGRAYVTRPRVLRLADGYLSERSLAALAQPIVEDVRDAVGESCSLGVLDGADVLYVARASHARIMAVGLHVGSRIPAWCTSMGRVLLATLPEPDRERLLPEHLMPFTKLTAKDRKQIMARIDDARTLGYAIVDQELEMGLRSIAVPVVDRSGRTVGALNVGTNAALRDLEELRTRELPILRRAAERLGHLLR